MPVVAVCIWAPAAVMFTSPPVKEDAEARVSVLAALRIVPPDMLTEPIVSLKLERSKVPLVSVTVEVSAIWAAAANAKMPPLMVTLPMMVLLFAAAFWSLKDPELTVVTPV